jgi:hypothetical protein
MCHGGSAPGDSREKGNWAGGVKWEIKRKWKIEIKGYYRHDIIL